MTALAPSRPTRIVGNERVRAHRGESRVKMNKNETSQPKPGAYPGFVPGRRQSKHDRASGEEVDGMGFKGQ